MKERERRKGRGERRGRRERRKGKRGEESEREGGGRDERQLQYIVIFQLTHLLGLP